MSDKEYVFRNLVPHQRELDDLIPNIGGLGDTMTNVFSDKRICFVGGGESPIYMNLHEKGILPKSLTNIDPYARKTLEYQMHENCHLVRKDFLKTYYQNAFDEIWAMFSLPAYCENLNQIKTFWKKSIIALAPKGKLRVCPINAKLSIEGTSVRADYSEKQYEINQKIIQKLASNIPINAQDTFNPKRPAHTAAATISLDVPQSEKLAINRFVYNEL